MIFLQSDLQKNFIAFIVDDDQKYNFVELSNFSFGRSRWLVRQFSTIVVGVVLTFAANIVDNDVTIIFAIVDDDVTGIFAFVFIWKPLVFAVL